MARNEQFFAILDIAPLRAGHVLVIPNQEVDYIFDLDDTILSDYMRFAKMVARAIEKVISCKRIGIAVVGLEVPHAHIHLVPLDHVGDINFESPKLTIDKIEMQRICDEISDAFTSLYPDFSK